MAKSKNFKSDLSLICSKDELRPVMQNIIFDNGKLICTNAEVLVKQCLKQHDFLDEEIAEMEGKCLNKDTFKEIYRYDYVSVIDGHFVCKKGKVEAKFKLQELDGKYPNYDAVLPRADQAKEISKFGLKLSLLDLVRKSILSESTGAEFRLHGEQKAVLIKSPHLSWDEETILIMPYSLY